MEARFMLPTPDILRGIYGDEMALLITPVNKDNVVLKTRSAAIDTQIILRLSKRLKWWNFSKAIESTFATVVVS